MAAHAAVPARRHFSTHGWGIPVTLGIAYALYAGTNARQGGPTTWGDFWVGLISGVVVAVAVWTLHRFGRHLRREVRAAAWGALAGIAIGFLYSLTGASVYSSTLLGLIVAAVNGGAAFYLFFTHEDAYGRPAPY
ncbi:hypothetical protein ACGF1Z_21530 [Streptomyces sp. NPDC048018]|uniref:hypothetical protein n=1 Tax=Streptomyces sp. NPDC048018 TaxID=3365499 RepID=UPI003715A8A2